MLVGALAAGIITSMTFSLPSLPVIGAMLIYFLILSFLVPFVAGILKNFGIKIL